MTSSPGNSVCVRLSYLQRSRWHPQEVQVNQSASGAQSCLLPHSHLFQLQEMKQINHKFAKSHRIEDVILESPSLSG